MERIQAIQEGEYLFSINVLICSLIISLMYRRLDSWFEAFFKEVYKQHVADKTPTFGTQAAF